MSDRVNSPLPDMLADRVVVADGGMGRALQSQSLTPDDFAGLGGCNEILNVTRPDRIGVKLSEEFPLHPEQSTDALIAHHPEAKYFNA